MQQEKPKAIKQHCKYCFDVLINTLQNKAMPDWPLHFQNYKLPIFVTWKKKGDLRGCIGTFSAGQIKNILGQYALTAALQDSRFSPIKESEIKDLSVGVSFLVNFESGKKAYDWTIGKHGIIIKAVIGGFPYSSTFLPEVAQEHDFTQQETLKHLIRKAGYNGDLTTFIEKLELTTYQSSKQYLTYQEYIKMAK